MLRRPAGAAVGGDSGAVSYDARGRGEEVFGGEDVSCCHMSGRYGFCLSFFFFGGWSWLTKAGQIPCGKGDCGVGDCDQSDGDFEVSGGEGEGAVGGGDGVV